MRRHRGWTLAEVLVASAISVLLLGLLLQILTISSAGWRAMRGRQDSQQSCLALLSHLRHDFRHAAPPSVHVASSSSGWVLSFLSPEGEDLLPAWDETGQILWRSWIQYRYSAAGKEVQKRRVALTPPTSAAARAAPAWPDEVRGRVLARQVVEAMPTVRPGALDATFVVGEGKTASATRLRLLSEFYGQDGT